MSARPPRRRLHARVFLVLLAAYLSFFALPAFKSIRDDPVVERERELTRDDARTLIAEPSTDDRDVPVASEPVDDAPRAQSPQAPSHASTPTKAAWGGRKRSTRALKLSEFAPREHFEGAGDVVKWGQDFFVESARKCHDECVRLKDKGCTTWVWCADANGCLGQKHKSCWLKKQAKPQSMQGTKAKSNPWTSGSIYEQDDARGDPDPKRKFHVVMTTNKAVYQGWQARVMYYHYKKQKALQGPNGQMGGFTRVLHDDSDGLEEEIPTCRVDRLEDELGFVVLSRPYAFIQFFKKCPPIEEEFILMAEPDHVYIKPLPNLMRGDTPAAFPFFYIVPKDKPEIVKRFLPGIKDEEIPNIDGIGSSPVFIRKDDLERLAPEWASMSVALQKDKEAKDAWGWVIEMYGYTLAAYKLGIEHDMRPQLQSQPPWDKEIGDFLSIHFTYGMDYDLQGKFTPGKVGAWRFDKRSYQNAYPPKNIPSPPEGTDNDLVRLFIDAVNEASANLPDWGKWGSDVIIADKFTR
ncbi:unnamed product [Ostreococcus tauri]|uniref:Unnamed product n=1 Tax=Ostreococcus tauri TaxID=70448 RepID=A0A096P904_OSTTA|nr:unnamed product [Ostreococcus tauri]CEG00521.1 unnamed product [Ostreococcus tauri]|eukprot:XP_022840422.1 unnamed product [Ostreococcus tauri]